MFLFVETCTNPIYMIKHQPESVNVNIEAELESNSIKD